jgi:hypothetical protein
MLNVHENDLADNLQLACSACNLPMNQLKAEQHIICAYTSRLQLTVFGYGADNERSPKERKDNIPWHQPGIRNSENKKPKGRHINL